MQAENKNYIVAIDLGSGSVTAAAGSKDPDGRLNIIDMVSKPMQGMSCGEVINIEQVTGAVRAAVGELEEHLGIKVTEAYAGISGHDIKCADRLLLRLRQRRRPRNLRRGCRQGSTKA